MVSVRRGGVLCALLLVGTAVWSGVTEAQDAETPPSASEEPADEEPSADAEAEGDAEDAPADEDDESESDEAEVTEGPDGEEWITPDVAAEEEEEQEQEDAIGDVDEVIINYDEDPETGDLITDSAGEEVPDVAVPVVSKTVDVQDPDQLEPGADKETGVQGQVVSRRPKKVLPDAPVLAKGDEDGRVRGTITDARGRYRLYLPPGRYTLRSYYDLYHGARWDNIDVKRGAFRRINFVLDPISEDDAGVEEQEVVYLADTTSELAQINIRKEAVAIQDSISAEEIKRAGDSTAKGAIRRVVGVTIDDSGFVIIRGLGGRYNKTLLNGVPIPGTDPDVPSVRLDVFPTDVVSSLSVVKTPRPDLPGAWAGGLLMIDTNQYPTEQQIKAGVSIGGNSLSTFRQLPSYRGGAIDWLGYDRNIRQLPSGVGNQRLDVGNRFEPGRYATPEQRDQIAREFSNIWNPRFKSAIPTLGLKFNVGNTVDLKKDGARVGYLLSFIYDYQEQIKTGQNNRFRFDPEGRANTDLPLFEFDYDRGVQSVLWGTFASAFIEPNPDHLLKFTQLFSRVSDDDTILQLGERENEQLPLTRNSYNFIGRTTFFNQLTGDHRNLGKTKLRLRWNAVVSNGKRDEPDRRQVQQLVLDQRIVQATRFFSELNQISVFGKTNIRFPVFEAFESTAYLTIGGEAAYEDRSFGARRFAYQNEGSINANLNGDPESVLGPDGIGTVSFLREVTFRTDAYTASNNLYGGFVQLETAIAPWLRFNGLMRFEMFRQEVASDSPFAADDDVEAPGTSRTDLDPLPSANFAFQVNDQMFVKLAYGQTVIRPAIRELAPFTYVDFLRNLTVSGDPDLRRTRVQNAEARYEYYFGGTDLLAATAFFKYLDSPIEFAIISQVNGAARYANADRGWLVGGEIELRLGFARFTEKLDKFFFSGNVAVIESRAFLPDDQGLGGRLERALFLQSPYVTNLSLRFDDPDSGVIAALVYNAFGKRIVEAGAGNSPDGFTPDVFQLAQHQLDLILSWQPQEHLKLGFKWKNISLARVRFKQGDQITFRSNFGTSVSISAEYSY